MQTIQCSNICFWYGQSSARLLVKIFFYITFCLSGGVKISATEVSLSELFLEAIYHAFIIPKSEKGPYSSLSGYKYQLSEILFVVLLRTTPDNITFKRIERSLKACTSMKITVFFPQIFSPVLQLIYDVVQTSLLLHYPIKDTKKVSWISLRSG